MTTRLTPEQIREGLDRLPGWQLKGIQISKQYEFNGFVEAMAFVNQMAALAERADHHPEILIRYRRVIVTLSTHSAGGLTEKDLALAKEIEALAGEHP